MSKYLKFETLPVEKGRKTAITEVRSKTHGNVLGRIKWYGAWRQFCFFPEPGTLFNRDCLDDINLMLKIRNREHVYSRPRSRR